MHVFVISFVCLVAGIEVNVKSTLGQNGVNPDGEVLDATSASSNDRPDTDFAPSTEAADTETCCPQLESLTSTGTPYLEINWSARTSTGTVADFLQHVSSTIPSTEQPLSDETLPVTSASALVLHLDMSQCAAATTELRLNSSIATLFLLHLSAKTCKWTLVVPEGQRAQITLQANAGPLLLQNYQFNITSLNEDPQETVASLLVNTSVLVNKTSLVQYTQTMDMDDCVYFVLSISFFDKPKPQTLQIVQLSDTNASPIYEVTSPCYGQNNASCFNETVNSTHTIHLPEDHVIVLLVTHLDLQDQGSVPGPCQNVSRFSIRSLSTRSEDNATSWVRCGRSSRIPVMVFSEPVLLHLILLPKMSAAGGLRLKYAVLPSHHQPRWLPDNGTYDCSVPHVEEFRPLFACDLIQDCQLHEDERGCDFTHEGCVHGVTFADDAGEEKCYKIVLPLVNETINWFDSKAACETEGGQLVTMATPEEWRRFRRLMGYGERLVNTQVMVGLSLSSTYRGSVAADWLYARVWRWVDERAAYYHQLRVPQKTRQVTALCAAFLRSDGVISSFHCDEDDAEAAYLCEFRKNSSGKVSTESLEFSPTMASGIPPDRSANASLVLCGKGKSLTRDFLQCDSQTLCLDVIAKTCPVQGTDIELPMFQCPRDHQTIPYTLVCDYRSHCMIGSEEKYCVYPELCPSGKFQCTNGQCIATKELCDGTPDCEDESDEESCRFFLSEISPSMPPPGAITLTSREGYSIMPLSSTSQTCPDTHFRCPRGYCLPVFLRCNGFADCPGREDELGCEQYWECPGLYHCRRSDVCLHPSHVCDGFVQCPQHDDEALCEDVGCPAGCVCQRLSFVCTSRFAAASYPDLRLVVADRTGMALEEFSTHSYLIRLHLRQCNVAEVQKIAMPNLRYLDLSYNKITTLQMALFCSGPSLEQLYLDGNPLTTIFADPSASHCLGNSRLSVFSLAFTKIISFNGSALSGLSTLSLLNISFSDLTTVQDGLGSVVSLRWLDLRNSPLVIFPEDLLKPLISLETAWVDNYKLCCRLMLPEEMDSSDCFHQEDELASCEDLVSSNFYRACLWGFAALAIFGNAGSFFARFYLKKSGTGSLGSYAVLVTSLCVADFLMGVYLAIIGVADMMYRGDYLAHDEEWRESRACQAAGALSLVSSEVSAGIICLVTLDRFLVLRFPFTRLHFSRNSATVAVGVVWVVGLTVAAVPLLPGPRDWNLYSQTGICSPLPFTTVSPSSSATLASHPSGRLYSFVVLIVLNFLLFLLIAIGQVAIYWSLRTNSMPGQHQGRGSVEGREAKVARRLTTVVVSDFLCWFPVGLIGLLTTTDTTLVIPREVNVGVAVMVLPLNSALNPFLYTLNILLEKRRRRAEARLLKILQMRQLATTPLGTRLAKERSETAEAVSMTTVTLTTSAKGTMTEFVCEEEAAWPTPMPKRSTASENLEPATATDDPACGKTDVWRRASEEEGERNSLLLTPPRVGAEDSVPLVQDAAPPAYSLVTLHPVMFPADGRQPATLNAKDMAMTLMSKELRRLGKTSALELISSLLDQSLLTPQDLLACLQGRPALERQPPLVERTAPEGDRLWRSERL